MDSRHTCECLDREHLSVKHLSHCEQTCRTRLCTVLICLLKLLLLFVLYSQSGHSIFLSTSNSGSSSSSWRTPPMTSSSPAGQLNSSSSSVPTHSHCYQVDCQNLPFGGCCSQRLIRLTSTIETARQPAPKTNPQYWSHCLSVILAIARASPKKSAKM